MEKNGKSIAELKDSIEENYEDALIFDLFKEFSTEGAPSVSSGLMGIDRILTVGGFPVGRVTELYGMESTGKSSLALKAIAEANRTGGIGVYFDAEGGLEAKYTKQLGVQEELFLPIRTDTGEGAFKIIIDELLPNLNVKIIVVDSLAAIIPAKEFEEELTKDQYSAKARMMAKALRRIAKPLGSSNAALIIINQLIDNIGGFGKTTPGGKALRFYSTIRLELEADRKLAVNVEKELGIRVTVRKNKIGMPWLKCAQLLRAGKGFDEAYDLYNEGLETDVIEKRGSWIYWGSLKFQGIGSFFEMLRNDEGERNDLRKEVMDQWAIWRNGT